MGFLMCQTDGNRYTTVNLTLLLNPPILALMVISFCFKNIICVFYSSPFSQKIYTYIKQFVISFPFVKIGEE